MLAVVEATYQRQNTTLHVPNLDLNNGSQLLLQRISIMTLRR